MPLHLHISAVSYFLRILPHGIIFFLLTVHRPPAQQDVQAPHGAAWRNDVPGVNVRHDPEHEADSSSGQSELVMPDMMQSKGGYGHGAGNRGGIRVGVFPGVNTRMSLSAHVDF